MGDSKRFEDLAARFAVRMEPARRELPGATRFTTKRAREIAQARHKENAKKYHQWHAEGRSLDEAREQGARQAGTEPDRPRSLRPIDDPWREDRWARQWHQRDDPWGNEP